MKAQRITSFVFMILGVIMIITGFTSKAAADSTIMSKLTGNTSITTGFLLLGVGAILFFVPGRSMAA